MNFSESLLYLEELSVFGTHLGLLRIEKLAQRLENPEKAYKTIHITGTNGKGSVSAMIDTVLRTAKIKTGIFTSPHLFDYRERIRVGGEKISESDFAKGLTKIREIIANMEEGEENPTQFEVLTALAFWYFKEQKVEYAVIEVGLGGLLDSTNIIFPVITVITNVTLDHVKECGGTLEGIAHHKAGIIKEAIPVVTAAKDLALDIIQKTAEKMSADIFIAGKDFQSKFVEQQGLLQRMEFSSEILGISKVSYTLELLGLNQVENSSVAFMTLELLMDHDERIKEEHILKGLEKTVWQGRFERMDINTQKIVIDGAHNTAGMKSLRENLDFYYPNEERLFLLGILQDKDIENMLKHLLREEDELIVTSVNSPRTGNTAYIATKAPAKIVYQESNRDKALNMALKKARGKLFIISGSLYLIGEIREKLLKIKENENFFFEKDSTEGA